MINTSNLASLNQLTQDLSTHSATAADSQELRASGKEIYVKQGLPKNTSKSARLKHQTNAKKVVVNLLVKQGVPKPQAEAMLKNVQNGSKAITMGNLKSLESLASTPSRWPSAQESSEVAQTSKSNQTFKTGLDMVKAHQNDLKKFGDFACTDIGTFGDKKSSFYQNKAGPRLASLAADKGRQAQDHKAAMKSTGMTIAIKGGNTPSESMLKGIADAVKGAQAGCCSTFAFSAASELLEGLSGSPTANPKVEVVAFKGGHSSTHLYVLVGREEGSDISDPKTWGDVSIVDPWASTAFGANMFGTKERPPISNMFPPTEVVFDSHKLDD
ncbi:hypothetical protein HQQ94_21885 [Shewanella sp. VB17]|uniref:hypothetical protein n=1 Tax=Shewanella sp. VB17 TaxID=2739432 RepID=UPI001563ACFE|nr:hypothetical protein [Shewanella sp. VB17]NRD75818.1 hypothetical protein [Shewanella sp. VB17]